MIPAVDILIIEPGLVGRNYWRDLWRYRELFSILAWRDVTVRYKQTVFGVAWALIQPFLAMVVFTLIFGRLASSPPKVPAVPIDGLRRPVAMAALRRHVHRISRSLVGSANLISKVYFPGSSSPPPGAVWLVDFLISLILLFVLMAWYGFPPRWQIFPLPFFGIMTILAGSAPAFAWRIQRGLSRLPVYIIPFGVQFGLFLSPVGFSSSGCRSNGSSGFAESHGGHRGWLSLRDLGPRLADLPSGLRASWSSLSCSCRSVCPFPHVETTLPTWFDDDSCPSLYHCRKPDQVLHDRPQCRQGRAQRHLARRHRTKRDSLTLPRQ